MRGACPGLFTPIFVRYYCWSEATVAGEEVAGDELSVREDICVVKPLTLIMAMGMVPFPTIKRLPDDPEWEEIERRMVAHNNKMLPPFEEAGE
jgi:hypothetical protein